MYYVTKLTVFIEYVRTGVDESLNMKNVTVDHHAMIGPITITANTPHLGTEDSVTPYVTTSTSVRLVPACSLIAAIFHFKCLQALGQRQPEAGAADSDNIFLHKHTYPKFESVCILHATYWALFHSPPFTVFLLLIVVLAALSARLQSYVIVGIN